jgi:hypothetical protein
VAFPSGALPEVVEHGRTGFIVDDEDGMVEAIDRAASLDRQDCRCVARERFSVERMADGYEAVYARMLARSGTAGSTGREGSARWTVVPISTPRSRRQAVAVSDGAADLEPRDGQDELPA